MWRIAWLYYLTLHLPCVLLDGAAAAGMSEVPALINLQSSPWRQNVMKGKLMDAARGDVIICRINGALRAASENRCVCRGRASASGPGLTAAPPLGANALASTSQCPVPAHPRDCRRVAGRPARSRKEPPQRLLVPASPCCSQFPGLWSPLPQ